MKIPPQAEIRRILKEKDPAKIRNLIDPTRDSLIGARWETALDEIAFPEGCNTKFKVIDDPTKFSIFLLENVKDKVVDALNANKIEFKLEERFDIINGKRTAVDSILTVDPCQDGFISKLILSLYNNRPDALKDPDRQSILHNPDKIKSFLFAKDLTTSPESGRGRGA